MRVSLILLMIISSVVSYYSQIEARCFGALTNVHLRDLESDGNGTLCIAGEELIRDESYGHIKRRESLFLGVMKYDEEYGNFKKWDKALYDKYGKGLIFHSTVRPACRISMFDDSTFIIGYQRMYAYAKISSKKITAKYSGWKSHYKDFAYAKDINKVVGIFEFDNHEYNDKYSNKCSNYFAVTKQTKDGIFESDKKILNYDYIFDQSEEIVAGSKDNFYLIGTKHTSPYYTKIYPLRYVQIAKQTKNPEGGIGGSITELQVAGEDIGEEYDRYSATYVEKNQAIYYIVYDTETNERCLKSVQTDGTNLTSNTPLSKLQITKEVLGSKFNIKGESGTKAYLQTDGEHLYLFLVKSGYFEGVKDQYFIMKLSLDGQLLAEEEITLYASEKRRTKVKEFTNETFEELDVIDFCYTGDSRFAFILSNKITLDNYYSSLFTFKFE